MEYFVEQDSIVRKIWGKADTILLIFAGASAEFALNKAVDWLYFTGRLPADPLARLFSTVAYAKQIIFSEKEKAYAAIDRMRAIHSSVEKTRGAKIPDWAYRDVLFMLIYYSISSFEALERKLTPSEKDELVSIFCDVGTRMGLQNLPPDHLTWLKDRQRQLKEDLRKSHYTTDLYKQYRKHLGPVRYTLLIESQKMITPQQVKNLLNFKRPLVLPPLIMAYKFLCFLKIEKWARDLIMPSAYKQQIRELDRKDR